MRQQANRAIRELVGHEALGEWAAKITGAEWVQVWWVQLLYKPSSDENASNVHVGWHQDRHYWGAWEEVIPEIGSGFSLSKEHIPKWLWPVTEHLDPKASNYPPPQLDEWTGEVWNVGVCRAKRSAVREFLQMYLQNKEVNRQESAREKVGADQVFVRFADQELDIQRNGLGEDSRPTMEGSLTT